MAPIQEPNDSLLHIERISQYVPLPPPSLLAPLPAISAEVFSPLLLSYYAPVKGVVLAYEDVQLSSRPPASSTSAKKSKRSPIQEEVEEDEEEMGIVLTRCVDEYMAPYVWASASLLVWRPTPNSYLAATLTHQSATHITLAHLNTFAISILKENLPADWVWHAEQAGKKKKGFDGRVADEGGCWVDGEGERVAKGREFRVRVREWDVRGGKGRGHLRIEGSLLGVEEERARDKRRGGKKAVAEVD